MVTSRPEMGFLAPPHSEPAMSRSGVSSSKIAFMERNGISAAACQECQKLTAVFASVTVEAVAIRKEILARTRARMDISQKSIRWLQEEQATLDAIKEQLETHRRSHRPANCLSVSERVSFASYAEGR